MTDRRAQRVHPDLRRHDAIDRYVGLPLILAVGVALLVLVVVLYRDARGRLTAPAVVVLLVITVVALLVLYAARHAWDRRRWYERLTSLLEREPIQARVWFGEGGVRWSAAIVEPINPSWPALELQVIEPRFDTNQLNGTVVSAYMDASADGPVVLQTPHGIVWPINGRARSRRSSPDLHRAVAVMRAAGLSAEANDLESTITAAYTSGSEMIGEIGLAILRLERAERPLPSEVKEIFAAMMDDVRKVFPDIGT